MSRAPGWGKRWETAAPCERVPHGAPSHCCGMHPQPSSFRRYPRLKKSLLLLLLLLLLLAAAAYGE